MVDNSTILEALRFNLASLQDFDPAILITGDKDVDGFVLSMALAYNDLKTIQWMNFMLECHRPTPVDALTAVSGQWNGMRVQAARWLMAMAHEILNAIARAEETGVLKKASIRKAVRDMTPDHAKDWKELVRVSTGRIQASGPLRGYLREIRNEGVFHYAYADSLSRAYRAFFATDDKIGHNQRAYLSIGPTMNQTRFFFADAAAQRMYCGESDLQVRFDESEELLQKLHHTLAGFVFLYLKRIHRSEAQ